MLGHLSLFFRKRRARKEAGEITETYKTWEKELWSLPSPQPQAGKTLLIRLDDIGDYILFRNSLAIYRRYYCPENGHSLYLLGNEAWKPVFDVYDTSGIQALWIDKKRYRHDEAYRQLTWKKLRNEGFETVICPARTRPLLLDDLCMLACAPIRSIAAVNTHKIPSWNTISDKLYTQLNDLSLSPEHEFIFNISFARYACPVPGTEIPRLHIDTTDEPVYDRPYMICFIGASAKSKLWPVSRWIKLINLVKDQFSGNILIAGGPTEKTMAGQVAAATGGMNIAGTQTLPEMVNLIARAQVIISNDTMAAHIGAASGSNTVIITTGNNGYRFTDYSQVGIKNVTTVYSPRYNRLLKKGQRQRQQVFQGVTSDIAAISEQTVFAAVRKYIGS